MDKLTTQQRHHNMAAIRSKDTKPEMIVRRGLVDLRDRNIDPKERAFVMFMRLQE